MIAKKSIHTVTVQNDGATKRDQEVEAVRDGVLGAKVEIGIAAVVENEKSDVVIVAVETGAVEARTGAVVAGTGEVIAGTGIVEAKTGAVEAKTGGVEAETNVVEAKTGAGHGVKIEDIDVVEAETGRGHVVEAELPATADLDLQFKQPIKSSQNLRKLR